MGISISWSEITPTCFEFKIAVCQFLTLVVKIDCVMYTSYVPRAGTVDIHKPLSVDSCRFPTHWCRFLSLACAVIRLVSRAYCPCHLETVLFEGAHFQSDCPRITPRAKQFCQISCRNYKRTKLPTSAFHSEDCSWFLKCKRQCNLVGFVINMLNVP